MLDPNVKDLYFQKEWDTEQYAAGMRQLKDVVSYLFPSFMFNLLTTLISLTVIILHPHKLWQQQK